MQSNPTPINPQPKTISAKGRQVICRKSYDTTMCLKLREVYTDEFIKKYDIGYHSSDNGGIAKRRQRHNAVLVCALKYILSHIIVNDSFYCAPYNGKYRFMLKMRKKPKWEIERILKYKPTMYRGIDLIRTGGLIYELAFFMNDCPHGEKTRRVHVGKEQWRPLQELINNGKKYDSVTTNHQLTHREVSDHVVAMFPDADPVKIRRIIIFGMHRMGKFNTLGLGIYFCGQNGFTFRSYIYKDYDKNERKRIAIVTAKTANLNKEGKESPHKKLLKHITWQRTKTRLKKVPS